MSNVTVTDQRKELKSVYCFVCPEFLQSHEERNDIIILVKKHNSFEGLEIYNTLQFCLSDYKNLCFLADKVLNIFGKVNDLASRANQLFVVGKGLTQAGVNLLGAQLANMTIGDLEAMLHARKIDPFLIRQLVKDFIDLAKALVIVTV